eukprot:911728-Rhodomonas_salina.1
MTLACDLRHEECRPGHASSDSEERVLPGRRAEVRIVSHMSNQVRRTCYALSGTGLQRMPLRGL